MHPYSQMAHFAAAKASQAGTVMRGAATAAMTRVSAVMGPRAGATAVAAHDAASHIVRQVANWRPGLHSADADNLRDMDMSKARGRDLGRNNPFMRNAIRINQDSVLGVGLKLSLKPDAKVLGVDEKVLREWAKQVERKFELWANGGIERNVDARRMQTLNQILRTAENEHFVGGESLIILTWRKPGFETNVGTCLQLIDADRLSTPDTMTESVKLRKGVLRNHWGEPVAYFIREGHPSDYDLGAWQAKTRRRRIRRKTAYGRTNVIHLFDQDRAEMTRGLTGFIAAIKPAKVLGQYQDVTLERAIIQSIFAAAIKTTVNYDDALRMIGADKFKASGQNPLTAMAIDYMGQTADYHRKAGFGWQGAQAIHLLPNEDLELFRSEAADRTFADFEKSVMRQIAAATGTPVTALSQNYADVNYSAARAALHDVWRHYLTRRQDVIDGMAWPIFHAWLEEAVAVGEVELPAGVSDFYAARAALTRGRWYAWGKPILDPVKEWRGREIALQLGSTTLEEIAAEDGRDWEEVLEQRARENARMEELGLEPQEINPQLLQSMPPDKGAGSQTGNPSSDDETQEGEGGPD